METRAGGRRDWRRAAAGGAVAGIVGGIVIAGALVVQNVAGGRGFWTAFKGAAAPFLGERVMAPGFDAGAVLLGSLCHFAISIGWGVLFGLIAYGFSKGATVALGAAWGLVVWVGMYYVLLPMVGLGEMARSSPVGMAILNHLLFGLGVGIGFLPYQRPRTLTAPMDRRVPTTP
jgi:hypothetical protein